MGFRNFFHSFHAHEPKQSTVNSSAPEKTQSSWSKERQNFLNSLKVDVSNSPSYLQGSKAPISSSQGGGRERDDELTHTREDDLKIDSTVQKTVSTTEENHLQTETSDTLQENDSMGKETTSAVQGNESTEAEDMEDADGLGL